MNSQGRKKSVAPEPRNEAELELLGLALNELAGPALLLDASLNVVTSTPGAEQLAGTALPRGVAAAKLLCGTGTNRPIAEGLSKEEPVTAQVERPGPNGQPQMIQIRALPLRAQNESVAGWILLLSPLFTADDDQSGTVRRWGLLTRDPGMKQLLEQVARVARSNASVLVRGETGAGKELVARAVHSASKRSTGPFRAINCAALPPALLESELFGHVRGAFTGAVRDALGHFRLADGGTLFLDEIGELPMEVQAKLLRVLQEQTVVPVGGSQSVRVDVRIVAATHQALRLAVRENRFRADLLYRLRVIPLFLPPLRDRPGDVELLSRHFLESLSTESEREVTTMTPGAIKALLGYDWPGNVRELRNVIEYALVMGEGPLITEADLPPEVLGLALGHPTPNTPEPAAESLSAEAQRLLTALERAGGHHGRAAQALGISRVTLWRKLQKLDVAKE